MPGAKWLELLLQHVPDKGEHLVRYYGWYSNRRRGERKLLDEDSGEQGENGVVIECQKEFIDPELYKGVHPSFPTGFGRIKLPSV